MLADLVRDREPIHDREMDRKVCDFDQFLHALSHTCIVSLGFGTSEIHEGALVTAGSYIPISVRLPSAQQSTSSTCSSAFRPGKQPSSALITIRPLITSRYGIQVLLAAYA